MQQIYSKFGPQPFVSEKVKKYWKYFFSNNSYFIANFIKCHQLFKSILSYFFSPKVCLCKPTLYECKNTKPPAEYATLSPTYTEPSCTHKRDWGQKSLQTNQNSFPMDICILWLRKVYFHSWQPVWTFDGNARWAEPNEYVSIFIF